MDQLKEMQRMLTDMLKVFHDFCIEHSLRYYAIGGTALGAARHKGFIPWDNDVDLGMPRPDYEKLINIFNQEIGDQNLQLESPYSSDTRHYPYSFSKIYNTKTTLIELNLRSRRKIGIFLDIFPLDGIDEKNLKQATKYISWLLTLRNQLIFQCTSSNLYKKLLRLSFQRVLDILLPSKRLAKITDSFCKRVDYDSSRLVGNLAGNAGEKEFVPKNFFGNGVSMQFENISIICPAKIDEYLTAIYGNWRTPPPKEKQCLSHNCYIDLTESYLEL